MLVDLSKEAMRVLSPVIDEDEDSDIHMKKVLRTNARNFDDKFKIHKKEMQAK